MWKEWQLDIILKKAWNKGIILCGLSAGSICWFEEGVTDSIPGERTVLKCISFLPGSNCPHYNWEIYKNGYHQLLDRELIKEGYAADDGVAIHFIDDRIYKIVSSRTTAKAYYIQKKNGQVIENLLHTQYLGKN